MIHALPPAIVAGELVRLQTRQHVVALTFDGGGNADGAKRVLAVLRREHVAQLGDVLLGTAEGRKSDRDVTVFDSTGLAIQDLAIALAAMERADDLDLPTVEL